MENWSYAIASSLNHLLPETGDLMLDALGWACLVTMSRKRSSGRPRRQGSVKSNTVATAVELAGGVTAVARLCGVARQSVYSWIQQWRVERLIDALKLSRASGIPIERLAGDAFRPDSILIPKSPALSNKSDSEPE